MEAWIDGDLDQLAAEEIRRHVDGCPSCRAELELAVEVRATLRSLPAFEPSDRVLQAVRSETCGEAVTSAAASWLWRPVAAVAAVAAAALLVVVVATERRAPPRQSTTAEVERVTAETRLALSYLGSAARRAEVRLRARVVEDRAVAATMDGVSSTLRWARGSDAATATEQLKDEGSLQ
jgi:anti-sigma factor RsiW